jgi:hypothetical protein
MPRLRRSFPRSYDPEIEENMSWTALLIDSCHQYIYDTWKKLISYYSANTNYRYPLMAFRRLKSGRKRRKANKKFPDQKNTDSQITPLANGTPLQNTQDTSHERARSLRERLYDDEGLGMSYVASWFPLFAGAWLVSGITLQNIEILSLCIFPLIFTHLASHAKTQYQIPFLREMRILVLVISILFPLIINNWYSHAALSVISGSANVAYFLTSYGNARSIPHSLALSLITFLFPGLLAQIGIMSQLTPGTQSEVTSFTSFYPGYSILGLVPGSILAARTLLLSRSLFLDAGWTLNTTKRDKKGNETVRPGSFARLVVLVMILGPAIPSVQLPFRLLPDSFLLASAALLLLPKTAEAIQSPNANYSQICILLANLAFGLGVLMFLAGIISQ